MYVVVGWCRTHVTPADLQLQLQQTKCLQQISKTTRDSDMSYTYKAHQHNKWHRSNNTHLTSIVIVDVDTSLDASVMLHVVRLARRVDKLVATWFATASELVPPSGLRRCQVPQSIWADIKTYMIPIGSSCHGHNPQYCSMNSRRTTSPARGAVDGNAQEHAISWNVKPVCARGVVAMLVIWYWLYWYCPHYYCDLMLVVVVCC